MTIECSYKDCQYHSHHTLPDDGPFCDEERCLASEAELTEFGYNRKYELQISVWVSTGYNIIKEYDVHDDSMKYTLLMDAHYNKVRVYRRGDVWKSDPATGEYKIHHQYR